MTQIADWLRAARLAQTNPDTGRPWSQAYLADRVTQETGWRLYREAYVGYEQGKGMAPETLQRFVDFWARYGVEPPDLTPPAPERSLDERAVLAAERQAAAAELQATLMVRHVAALEAIAAKLTGEQQTQQAWTETEAWAQSALAALPLPRSAPTA
jgi:hypothetical protein